MIYYSSGDYERAIAEYEILVKHNPSNIFYSSILAQSYIKQKKFIQAGKVLNNLVKNNPKAKNNSYVKRYKLLMFFVK